MKILVIAHVHYPAFWPELATCIRNLDGMDRLIVTYCDELSIDAVKDDFPDATTNVTLVHLQAFSVPGMASFKVAFPEILKFMIHVINIIRNDTVYLGTSKIA